MSKKMFDFCIGNPPYNDERGENGRQPPVYHRFMDACQNVADCTELITPARFLFNAGQTPKEWNKRKLNDKHFKVLKYESDASKIFPNTEIKGGVTITLDDRNRFFNPIGVFIEYDSLKSILDKVRDKGEDSMSMIITGAVPYRYTETLKEEHPEYVKLCGDSFDLRTNTLDNLYDKLYFSKKINEDYVGIFGLYKKKRTTLWIDSRYVSGPSNFKKYKVLLGKAQGSGNFGEVFSEPVDGKPNIGHTQSFVSIGEFNTENEMINAKKYLKTKLCRCLLSILRKTPDIPPYKWKYVPLQDFTDHSDIDWSKPIPEIDQQLYRKYGLSDEEIDFIETHVKEMK